MPLELYSDAILTVDLPAVGLQAGDVGVVVERHVVPGQPDGYSVEFFDMTGRTLAVETLPETQLRVPQPGDRPAVRVLSGA